MSTKNRKHSGRKRPSGELVRLNLRKFEKMIALAGSRGFQATPHIDPRYYPTIVINTKKAREAGEGS
jgi:hypothetical protein